MPRPLTELGFACHTCDTPSCINPDHLFEGNYKINAQDRHKKGRSKGCWKNGNFQTLI